MRDWSATQAQYGGDYPPHSIMEVDVPLWPREQAQAYILERVKLHQAARRGLECDELYSRHEHYGMLDRPDGPCLDTLPLCSDDERWLRDSKFAVHKGGQKRAVKLHDTEAEAEAHAAELRAKDARVPYTVEARPGTPTRCLYFCTPGRMGLCEQYNAWQQAQEVAT
jgi:hypothetical protein